MQFRRFLSAIARLLLSSLAGSRAHAQTNTVHDEIPDPHDPGASGVVRLVFRETLAVILLGLAAGVTLAYLGGEYVETQLFGLMAVDGPVFAISIGTLLAASLVASLAPAWRASRISPVRPCATNSFRSPTGGRFRPPGGLRPNQILRNRLKPGLIPWRGNCI